MSGSREYYIAFLSNCEDWILTLVKAEVFKALVVETLGNIRKLGNMDDTDILLLSALPFLLSPVSLFFPTFF